MILPEPDVVPVAPTPSETAHLAEDVLLVAGGIVVGVPGHGTVLLGRQPMQDLIQAAEARVFLQGDKRIIAVQAKVSGGKQYEVSQRQSS